MPYAAILPITKADTMSETFIHPSSFVDDGAVIGPGCRIWHFSHIMAGAVLGPACNIGQNVIGRTISLGIVRLKQTDTPVIIACDLSKIGNRTGQFGHVCGVFLRLLIIATDTH